MFQKIANNVRLVWRPLVVTDILFKAISFVLLAPAVALLFRIFVSLSGRTVLADTDIASFFLHPIGWIALVIVGAAVVGLFALELAALMTVCIGADIGSIPRPRSVVRFVASQTFQLLRLAGSVVIRVALSAVPFLGIGAGLFWWLMTEHDINFYLAEKPPSFLLAVGLIGLTLAVMTMVIGYRLIGWIYATPILMLEDLEPEAAVAESNRRTGGQRGNIAIILIGWAVFNLAIRIALSLLVVSIAPRLVSIAASSLPILVIALGLLVLVLSLTNLISSLIGNITLASSLSMLYVQDRGSRQIAMPGRSERPLVAFGKHLTRGRVISAGIVLSLASAFFGLSLLRSIRVEDHVEITAHRGGALEAPENTIAAIEQAIKDGADWIEIDVQESSDGVVMVVHDSDLKRVAGDPVKIWEATADELRAIDIGSYFDDAFKDQRMPTLEEVLKICRDRVGVNIELKYYGHDQNLEQKVIDLVEANQMDSQIVAMSLEMNGIAKLKRLRPQWTVGLLTAVVAGDLTRTDADFLAVKDSLATGLFVDAAHRKGKSVSAWTLNDPHSISLMISRGVNNLITDRPALAQQVLEERSQMSPIERLTLEVAFYLGVKPQATLAKSMD